MNNYIDAYIEYHNGDIAKTHEILNKGMENHESLSHYFNYYWFTKNYPDFAEGFSHCDDEDRELVFFLLSAHTQGKDSKNYAYQVIQNLRTATSYYMLYEFHNDFMLSEDIALSYLNLAIKADYPLAYVAYGERLLNHTMYGVASFKHHDYKEKGQFYHIKAYDQLKQCSLTIEEFKKNIEDKIEIKDKITLLYNYLSEENCPFYKLGLKMLGDIYYKGYHKEDFTFEKAIAFYKASLTGNEKDLDTLYALSQLLESYKIKDYCIPYYEMYNNYLKNDPIGHLNCAKIEKKIEELRNIKTMVSKQEEFKAYIGFNSRNMPFAHYYYQKNYEMGDINHLYELAKSSETSEEAYQWYKEGMFNNDKLCLEELKFYYTYGMGVTQDSLMVSALETIIKDNTPKEE